MGQKKVFEYLAKIYQKNPSQWVTIEEIKDGLRKNGLNKRGICHVPSDVWKLVVFNRVEVKGKGLWKYNVYFRLRPTKRHNAKVCK